MYVLMWQSDRGDWFSDAENTWIKIVERILGLEENNFTWYLYSFNTETLNFTRLILQK